MAFTEQLALLPFSASTPNGRGFLPPIVRSLGHILYLVGCIADPTVEVTNDQAIVELGHASTHWNARTTPANLSTITATYAANIHRLIELAIEEYGDWTDETRITNLRNVTNRILQFTAALDREYAGIRDSDPGSSL
jgi:hypothetical protein